MILVLVLVRCKFCGKPHAKVQQGAHYEVWCCKVEQKGVA